MNPATSQSAALSMSTVFDQVQIDIITAIKNDELVLPTLPEIALQVRDIAMDPNATMDRLAEIIGNDPSLSARIIKVANSPLVRASREIEGLNMALARLGMDYICSIATGLAMEQMFQATSNVVDKRMRQVWSRAAEVAGIAHVVTKHFTRLRPDQATLAGLVHSIGALPILTYAETNQSLLADGLTLDRVLEKLSPAIGNRILKTWNFPEEVQQVPVQCLDFTSQKENPDYADVVTVALIESYKGSSHALAKIATEKVTAFQRLGMVDEEYENEDLSAEMDEAMKLLTGDN